MKINMSEVKRLAYVWSEGDKVSSTDLSNSATIFNNLVDFWNKNLEPVVINGKVAASGCLDAMMKKCGEDVKHTINFYYHINRSKVCSTKSSNYPRLAGLTPIPMYILKEKCGIGYNEWDKTDPALEFFMGKNLSKLITLETVPAFANGKYGTAEEINTARTNLGTPLTGWPRKNVLGLGSNHLTSIALQVWLANGTLRVPDAMILDLWDWDNVPEALDATVTIQKRNML